MSELEKFIAFADSSQLLDRLPKGGPLPTVVPRILGKGKSKAEGLLEERPPALIERLHEYAKLDLTRLGNEVSCEIPESVIEEQSGIKKYIHDFKCRLREEKNSWQRFAREILSTLGDPTPGRSGKFVKGDLELVFDPKSLTWSWCLAGAYPLVSKLPPEKDYVIDGLNAAEKKLQDFLIDPVEFLKKLTLAWKMARHFSESEQVLIKDVARLYHVAAQPESFWLRPSKQSFTDLSDAAFVLNLTKSIEVVRSRFELEKATIHQGKLGKGTAYPLPKRGSPGTEPYSYIRLKTNL